MTRKHTAALKALIQQVPAVATKTFVTVARYPAPNQAVKVEPPYVVIHPADGADEATRFTGPRDTMHPRFVVHTVGTTAEMAQLVAEQWKAKLIVNGFGIRPEVPGERTDRFWWDSPIPVQVDKDVTPWLCYHVAECGFTSHPE